MKKIIVITFIFTLVFAHSKAQENKADSLFNKSKKFWYNNTDSGKFLLTKSLEAARIANYLKGQANALKGLGFLANSSTERLQFYFKALDIRQQLGDSVGVGVSLNDIGTVYRSLGERSKSMDYFSRSLAIRKKIKDHGGIAQTLIEFGHNLEEDGDYRKALQTFRESLQHRLMAGEINGIAYSHINIASVFANLKQCDSAFFFCSVAEKEFAQANNQTIASWLNWIRGKCFTENGQTAQAINELQMIDSTSLYFLKATLLLSEIYEHQQDFKQALVYRKKWMSANKIWEEKSNAKAVRELAADYEFKMMQTEAAQKEEKDRLKKRRQDNLQLMLITIGLIGIFVFIISVRRKFSERTVNVLMFVGFLIVFEFIVVLIDPALQNLSGNKPVLLLLGNTLVALIIAPLHGFVEKYFKKKMSATIETNQPNL